MNAPKWMTNMLGSQTQKPFGEDSFVASDTKGTTVVYRKSELAKKMHGYAASCQHAIANGVSGLDILAKHPRTLRVLTNSRDVVNECFSCTLSKLTRQDLLYKLASDLSMAGNAYMANLGEGLEYLSSDVSVKTWITYEGMLSVPKEYLIDTGKTTPRTLPADSLVHFKYRLLDGSSAGRGALEDCNLEADTIASIARFVNGYFKNAAIPGMHLRVAKGGMKADKFTAFARKVQDAFSNGGTGGTFVTSDGVTAHVLGNNLVDAKAVDVLSALKVVICGTYGVPVDIIDQSSTNRATAQASMRLFHTNTVMPIAWAICDRMNQAYKNVVFEPVPFDTIDPIEGDKVISQFVKDGVLTIDEARQRLRSVNVSDKTKGIPNENSVQG